MTINPNTAPHRMVWRLFAATAVSAAMSASFGAAANADEALADLVEQVAPSVVTVLSIRNIDSAPVGSGNFDMPNGSQFEDYFKHFGPGRGVPEQFRNNPPAQGLGSGFILDAEGWIVTNHHVVDAADSVMVRLSDNREFEAQIVGVDEQTDLALLRIETGGILPALELGDSDEIRVGEDVMAVGNPFGLGGTVTKGIVSAKGRNIASGPYAEFIQTDAAINKGNSGGPLFNLEGEVIGVNSAIYSPTGGSVGVGFAVTSNIVELIVGDLMDDGQVDRGWLGVSIQNVTQDLSDALGLDAPTGALVASVFEGGPADGTLENGDIVLEFAGTKVASSRELPKLVASIGAGEKVEIMIQRSGKIVTVSVNIGEFQTEMAGVEMEAEQEDTAYKALGATVATLTDNARAEIGVDESVEGVVVTSLSGTGPAARAGLQVGDVIVRLGDQDVTNPASLKNALSSEQADPALMLINRSGQQIFVAVSFA
jgi:serine protease Do